MSNVKKIEKTSGYHIRNESYISFSDAYDKTDRLPSGIFQPDFNQMSGQVIFTKVELKMDEILNLPDTNMNLLVNRINTFWSEGSYAKYKEYGLIQKFGILLYGKPGTGKTVLVAKLSKEIAENMDGVILFNPNVNLLSMFIKTIRENDPNRKIVILWEEFDSVVDQNETELLCLLDGEIQAENIVYLATTNYISEIPARIKNRPSRFSLVKEIGVPSLETRKAYFDFKLKSEEDKAKYLMALTDASEGFTIDQCKDLIVSVLLFDIPISEAVMKLNEIGDEHSYGYDDYQEENAKEIFKAKASEGNKIPKNPFRR